MFLLTDQFNKYNNVAIKPNDIKGAIAKGAFIRTFLNAEL